MRFHALHRLFRALLCFLLAGSGSLDTLALQPASSLNRYARQAWTTENGLPQNSVHALLQTSDGYLWMATEGGLARFNGYAFRIFDRETEPRLAGNDIRCLVEDRSHALWIGTSSGLTRLQDGATQTYTSADGLPSDTVQSLLQAKDGVLWVLTSRGLASLAPADSASARGRFQSYAQPGGPLDAQVNAIAKAEEGVWAAASTGLYLAGSSGIQRVSQVPSTAISALATDAAGSLFFASADGVFALRNGSLSVLAKHDALPAGGVHQLLATVSAVWAAGKNGVMLIQQRGVTSFQTGEALPGDQVETIFADRAGAVWIGTDKGVSRWWNGRMESSAAGDNGTAVLSMQEDRDGDLWVGTETAGAVEWRERPFEMIGRAQGMGEGSATSVAETSDGGLWVGTNGGGVSRVDSASRVEGSSASTRTYTSRDGLASNTVLALARGRTPGTDLWIGTPDGLGHLLNGRVRMYGPADGLSDDYVRSLLVAHDGAVWIGTRHGVTRFENGRTATWTTAQGLGSNLIGAMAEDAAGNQWIGTLGGLSSIHNGTVTNYTVADGLPGNTVTAVAVEAGWLLAGINGKGLAVRDGGRFFSFAGVGDLPKTIFAILCDGHGYVWLSSDRGLDRIALSDLAAYRADTAHSIVVTHFGTADGLGSSKGSDAGHPSAVRLGNGRLCFAMRRGVVIVDPSLLPASHPSPPVVVEQITADDREVTRAELASLPPGPSHFAFSFAGISLASPQRLQYRYQLTGFDRDWILAGSRRTAFYTNLSPGRYRFRVNARYGSEPWGEADGAVDLQLRPRFYQTAWFRLLLLCLLAALLLGIYQLRVQALRSRFDAVAGERNRLAREIHDTLAQGFVAVSVRLEILSQMLRGNHMDECRQQLDETRALVHESLGEARRSIWNLRTEGADAQTLPARLLRTAQSVIARGVDSQVETTGVYRALPSAAEDELYRIAQEAVANALRHADATEIQIRLVYTQVDMRLEIMDDGRGFDVSAAPSREEGHFGLTGLKERADQIGATLILHSKPGHGTTVRLDVPLSRDEGKGGRN